MWSNRLWMIICSSRMMRKRVDPMAEKAATSSLLTPGALLFLSPCARPQTASHASHAHNDTPPLSLPRLLASPMAWFIFVPFVGFLKLLGFTAAGPAVGG